MATSTLITNDRSAKDAERMLDHIDSALSSEKVLVDIARGLPAEVISGLRRSLTTQRQELKAALEAYARGRAGDCEDLERRAGSDIGARLVVARLALGWSQKELARKLGLQEQAVQRYEVERYRSISLANLQKFASVLGLQLNLRDAPSVGEQWAISYEAPPAELRRVLKHARANGWLSDDGSSDENAISQLKRYMGDHIVRHSTPSLLRTGLQVVDHSNDWALLSWKAQVTRVAEKIINQDRITYSPLDLGWLIDLVHSSATIRGVSEAADTLRSHGIVLVYEPHIPGMAVDGASFLIDTVPVIGMTLRKDTIDNFWFTLLHEIGHVILHYRTGLVSGFFDDFDDHDIDEAEEEANLFASNLLIPEAVWSRSPARIAKAPDPIERFAKSLNIHPAIVFGRIRKERNQYHIFSDKIGQGTITKELFGHRRAT